MDNWSNVRDLARTVAAVRELFFGIGALYIFFRKKFKTFLFFAIALFSHATLSYFLPKLTQGQDVLALIGVLLVALMLSYKELRALDLTGKRAYEIFSWDWYDRIAFFLLLIAWIFLRIFVFDK